MIEKIKFFTSDWNLTGESSSFTGFSSKTSQQMALWMWTAAGIVTRYFLIDISKIIKNSQFKSQQIAEAMITIFVNIEVSRINKCQALDWYLFWNRFRHVKDWFFRYVVDGALIQAMDVTSAFCPYSLRTKGAQEEVSILFM